MKQRMRQRGGYTLIELVAVLLLGGLLATGFVLAVVPVTEGMLLLRQHTGSVQKAQHFFSRMNRELVTATNVVSGTAQALVFDRLGEGGSSQRRTLNWGGGAVVTLNDVPLYDDTASFALRYYETPAGTPQVSWSSSTRLIEIVLQSQTGSGILYTNRVYMRNTR